MQSIRKIFVIMPFSKTKKSHTKEYWTNHFENILQPDIQTSDFPVERSAPLRKDILKEIINNLTRSQIVLADITDLNANVMWELGVRQSFRNGRSFHLNRGLSDPNPGAYRAPIGNGARTGPGFEMFWIRKKSVPEGSNKSKLLGLIWEIMMPDF